MISDETGFTDRLHKIASVCQLISDEASLEMALTNTLGIDRRVLGIAYPKGTDDVIRLVQLANQLDIALYPISRGMNIGYGDKLPASNDQLIVDLSQLNRIRQLDQRFGLVTVEPGVTQGDLYNFLLEQSASFLMDATGAGLNSSIVGNTIDGGFGHTALGNRRRSIVNIEVVLGNGTLFTTGVFPACGPDLSGLFVQSNFGIITALTLRLLPKPEACSAYVFRIWQRDAAGCALEAFSRLKQRGVIEAIPHMANAVRTAMTTQSFAETWNRTEVLSETDALELARNPVVKVAPWTVLGSISGMKADIRLAKREMKNELKGLGSAVFFSDTTVNFLTRVTAIKGLRRFRLFDPLSKSVSSLQGLTGLTMGIPTDLASANICWRVNDPAKMGLIWFAPVIKPCAADLDSLLSIASPLFDKHQLEMPVTVSLVEGHRAICVFSIGFDKSNADETDRAHRLYGLLDKQCCAAGFAPYRTSILGMPELKYETGKLAALRALKQALDPNNIISPGRYIV